MTMVGLIGGGLAISRATETQVAGGTPLSRLGVDDGAAETVTFTLLGLGIILLALGISLDRTFARLRSAGRLGRRAGWLLAIGFLVAGIALAITGLFPIDSRSSTDIHNLAGFAMPIVLMATMSAPGWHWEAWGRASTESRPRYVSASSACSWPRSSWVCFPMF